MKRRMKKFSEGGGIAKSESYTAEPDSFVGPKISSQESFRRKFAKERAAGKKTFEWNGKTYTTELASEKAKRVVKPASETAAPATTAAKASASEPKAETKKETKTTPKVEEFSAAGTRSVPLDSSSKVSAKEAKSKPFNDYLNRNEPHMSELKDINQRKPADTSPRKLGMNNFPRLSGPRGGGGGGGGSGTRQLMLGSDLDPKALMRDNRSPRGDDESRFADEGNPNFKRGGKVKKYAKGGSVSSSASKRADGCATKGKTRGRIY